MIEITRGEIEKNIYAWANKYEGIVIKSERDTFICFFT